MKSFIEETLLQLIENQQLNLPETLFVLPSKRAGGFLKEHLKTIVQDTTLFAPTVMSIEEFTQDVSGLLPLDNTHSIFKFYNSYKSLTPKEEQEDFDTFYNWAQTIIYDFNEIDRYLIDPNSFFNYLGRIQDLNHWSIKKPQTTLVKNYLSFWKKLPDYYSTFTQTIIENKEAYQGLMYRKAAEKIKKYLSSLKKHIVFVGFNALNTAEQVIIQEILVQNKGQIFWDMDQSFYNDPEHDASLFLRQYRNSWEYYTKLHTPFPTLSDHYQEAKRIELIGIPKNVGQAKYVGKLLEEIPKASLSKTALILNEEALLAPMLNSFPSSVENINITMGLPLKDTPITSFFELLFIIQEESSSGYYFKNIVDLLNHPILVQKLGSVAHELQQQLAKENMVFISQEELLSFTTNEENTKLISYCISLCSTPQAFLQNLIQLSLLLKPNNSSSASLETEYLFHFHKLFTKLQNLLSQNNPIKNIKALHRIYKDALSTETLDYIGSPFDGLQVMGMLESRVLDFETIILTSVNEGILPAGKSTNSFIPFDLKKEYGLPTYKEKDAVYTYHFYRLLQRAKNIYLLYNTDKTGLGSREKSRFLTQLEIEKQPNHTLTQKLINPKVFSFPKQEKRIEKSPETLLKLQRLAAHGFSPSALTSYIRNPIDFYKKYVLGIQDTEEVEETVAANTLGTIVHDTLENFYKPLINKAVTLADLKKMQENVANQVENEFAKTYKKAPIHKGKNLIIYEIAKRYIKNLIKQEIDLINDNNITIVAVESKLKTELPCAVDFPVHLTGKVDRVDLFNDTLRIIDYKTGNVQPNDLAISNWEELTKDIKYSKAFQVLCYTYMMHSQKNIHQAEGGIISFKNLKSGFLKFKDTSTGKANYSIDQETFTLFEGEIKKLVAELLDPNLPFIEKEI